MILGRTLEEIPFLSNIELYTRKQSSLAEILAASTLLFGYVNLPRFGLKSVGSHATMKLSTIFSIGSFPYTPPDFSFSFNIKFKSPMTIILEKELESRQATGELQ